MRYPKPQDKVEIITPIGKEFENDMVGTVINCNDEYIFIELDKSGVDIELYPCEIKILPS